MKIIATFISKNRTNATICAFLGFLVPILSPATVGLVTLSQSFSEAFLILLWASLLPIFTTYYAEVTVLSELGLLLTLSVLIVIYVAAVLLSASRSLPFTLIALPLISTACCLISMRLSGTNDEILQAINLLLANANIDQLISINFFTILGLGSYIITLQACLALMLSRHWQLLAMHVNEPNTEFIKLHFDKFSGLFLGALLALTIFSNTLHKVWFELFLLPLIIVGCSCSHWLLNNKRLGNSFVYACLYISLLLFESVRLIVGSLALIDSQFNIRNHFNHLPRGKNDGDHSS